MTSTPTSPGEQAIWNVPDSVCNLVKALGKPSKGSPGCAPLAQSAERFHGKEKVDGSIPSGGSQDQTSPQGGVAQLVRAHDS